MGFLPAVEVSSMELVECFAARGTPWPKKMLPASLAKLMSERAQKLCPLLIVEENAGFLSKGIDDFSWLKWTVGFPAKRNHFLAGLQLQHDQIEAILLRACLEQLTAGSRPLSDEQADRLRLHLTKLSAKTIVGNPAGVSKCSVASQLLMALAQKPGALQHIFASRTHAKDGVDAFEANP